MNTNNMNTKYIMEQMWNQLRILPPEARWTITQKLLGSEKLSSQEQVLFENAFNVAYDIVHGED